MKNRVYSFPRRNSLKYAIALCAGSAAIAPVVAQDAQPAPSVDEIVITGSRVQRNANALSSQPVSTIQADDFNRTATSDIVEVMNDNPALLSSVSATNSLDGAAENVSSADNVGGSTLDLRGLGYERTLTLVNGRRHVSGVEGTSAVDVSTIPTALIERVEVLTGGASAIYGADAVTGVVNFILKDSFEGIELDVRPSISEEGDAESANFSALLGTNFDDMKGNVVLGLQVEHSAGLRGRDRPFASYGGLHNDDVNPALRFQQGDIDPATMPNLSQYYNFDNTGLFPWGLRIPDTETFAGNYESSFGSSPSLTPEEQALFARATTASPRAYLPGRTFNITSPYGVVSLGDFGLETPLGSEPDLDGDGTPDCLQSFTGYNSSLDGAGSFGAVGGCWIMNEDGEPVPYQDGLVAGNFNQFGAEDSYIAQGRRYIIPQETKYAINLNGAYDITPSMTAFVESKYVYHEVEFGGSGHHATDLLYGAPDNPFLPSELAPFANNNGVGFVGPGGLYVSRDSDDWGENISTNERETYRVVAGLRGSWDNLGLDYEVSANYGRFDRKLTDRENVITDRFFAAIDVVNDPSTGQPVCRSDLDPTAYPQSTPFNFPNYVGGGVPSSFFTFQPGDGQCQPANIWGGRGSISQEAIDFFTYTSTVEDKIEQQVVTAFVSGDSGNFFELPAGAIGFAAGFEWREESSAQTYDNYDQGILPVSGVTWDGQAFSAGDWVGDVSNASSLGSSPGNRALSGSASYDVVDIFAEVEVPILMGMPFAEELTLSAAGRRADYSTFGENDTWKVGALWAPIEDLRIRANLSEAVRVPNLFELFSPEQGQNFRPADPCDVSQLSSASNPALRQANCVAALQAANVDNSNIFDGSGNYNFQDPLSAGFAGVVGGNPNLEPEEATTKTLGFVYQPYFLAGLTLSVDYWNIEIDQAIEEVSAQNIVNSCYDAPSTDNAFCELVQRNPTTTSAQSGGFIFLRQTLLNFGAAEAEGIDTSVNYSFDVGAYTLALRGAVTKQNKLEFRQPSTPGEPPVVDNELGLMRSPEWSGQLGTTLMTGPLSVSWRANFLGEQALDYNSGNDVATLVENFGPSVITDDFWSHDLNATWDFSPAMRLYGGISNVTDEKPFVTERGYPVSAVGRAYFLGLNYTF